MPIARNLEGLNVTQSRVIQMKTKFTKYFETALEMDLRSTNPWITEEHSTFAVNNILHVAQRTGHLKTVIMLSI